MFPNPTSSFLVVGLSFLFLFAAPVIGVTRKTVVVTRGADPGFLTSTLDPAEFGDGPDGATNAIGGVCAYDGGIVSLSHPMSLKPSDKFFSTGQLQLRAIEMVVDEVNLSPRCGITVGGKRHGVSLTTYGDDSSKSKIGAIVGNAMVRTPPPTFWLGPYSSGLTGAMSPHANATGSVLVAGGAASTPVFRDNPTVFGTFPPTKNYLAQAVAALAEAGAKSAAVIWEDASFTRGVCAAVPELTAEHGLVLQSETEVASGPTAEHLDPVAAELALEENDPDVVVTCVYDAGCAEWVASLRRAGWSPRAQVFTVCIGMDSFVGAVGADAKYMMGVSPWDPSLPMQDALVGWSASEFADEFLATTARTATYHAASAAASVGMLLQAIERADSLLPEDVASVLATDEFSTLYGRISFNGDGQSKAPALVLQYDDDIEVQTVYPLEQKSGDLIYPMPTWDHRDCLNRSTCEVGYSGYAKPGRCRPDGTCECSNNSDTSVGVGADAGCIRIPEEDMTYVSRGLSIVGFVLVAIQFVLSAGFSVWIIIFRKRSVIRASQPVFLGLICLGTFLISSGIIPISVQGEYRYEQDPITGELTDIPNDDTRRVDAACMALPWLFCLGFVIVFSALFAKIRKVEKVLQNTQRLRRTQVDNKDVASVMVVLLTIVVIILLTWQLVDPLRWERTVVSEDGSGFPTKSVGACQCDNMLAFLVPLLILVTGCLLYALYLCYVNRKMPSEYAESKWITASIVSIFQILILAIPILVIVENDNNAFYFVRAAVMFLISSTVTLLIFLPKAYKVHFKSSLNSGGVERRGTKLNFLRKTAVSRRAIPSNLLTRQNSQASMGSVDEIRARVAKKKSMEHVNNHSIDQCGDSNHANVSNISISSGVENRSRSMDHVHNSTHSTHSGVEIPAGAARTRSMDHVHNSNTSTGSGIEMPARSTRRRSMGDGGNSSRREEGALKQDKLEEEEKTTEEEAIYF